MPLLDPELLKVLTCPVCKGPLEPREKQQLLACKPCGKGYPIEDSIPVLMVEKARPLA